jgi:hypothetical protein
MYVTVFVVTLNAPATQTFTKDARSFKIAVQHLEQSQSPTSLDQWYSTFFVRVPPDIISLQLCTPKVVGT